MDIEVVKEAHRQQLLILTKTLRSEKEQVKKHYDAFSTSCESLIQELEEYTELVEEVLQSTPHEEMTRTDFIFESLQACFTNPGDKLMQLMDKIKRQHLLETQQVHFANLLLMPSNMYFSFLNLILIFSFQVYKDYFMMKKSEVLKARSILSKYDSKRLAQPTPGPITVDPSSHLASISDTTLCYRFSSTLQGIAPICPVPDFIYRNEIYAVFSKQGNWPWAAVSIPNYGDIFKVCIII